MKKKNLNALAMSMMGVAMILPSCKGDRQQQQQAESTQGAREQKGVALFLPQPSITASRKLVKAIWAGPPMSIQTIWAGPRAGILTAGKANL